MARPHKDPSPPAGRRPLPPEDPGLAEIEAGESIAADDVPELDAASEDAGIEQDREAHASETIIGDTNGDDYRAGTIAPDGSDRGPWEELGEDRFDGDEGRDERPHGGLVR